MGDGGTGEADRAVAEASDAFGLVERGETRGVIPVDLGDVRDDGAGPLFQGEHDIPVAGGVEYGVHGSPGGQQTRGHLVVGEDAAGSNPGVRFSTLAREPTMTVKFVFLPQGTAAVPRPPPGTACPQAFPRS
ncbi:hypothetical protein SAMN02787118_103349 [Streptomyces mirabilis]|uniref:Uncharacterized protein n=1 Tax=Streptomyces mirabilis TaxID=68239 RepID=A0A1I2F964_9ACTN|nr:hypothetical protein SAMN02787118_103349 [Streptomyces mirabilis]